MIEDMISMLNQTTKATEIRDYPLETDVLAAQTKACTTVLADLQPSASIQSPQHYNSNASCATTPRFPPSGLSRRLPPDRPATATVSSMGRHLLTLNKSSH